MRPMLSFLRLALCALLLVSIHPPAHAQSAPPAAPKREIADTYFGTVIADPYRWMEQPTATNPQFLGWLKAQNAYTREVLDRLPRRAPLAARLAKLADVVTTVNDVSLAGARWFYLKLQPGEQTAKLYARETRSQRERLLLDPDTLPGRGDSHWAIDYISPSPDGRLVGYGASLGGSERTTLYLMDAATGRLLPDSISRAQFGAIAWTPDGRSFYYNRLSAAGDTNPSQRYRNSAAYRHVVGSPVERDELVLGPGSSKTAAIAPDDFPLVFPIEGSPYVFAWVGHGVKNEVTIYAVRSSEFRGAATAWRKLVDVDDAVTAAEYHGSDVYLLSHKGAPRFKVLRIRADAPDLSGAEVVVPEGKAVLTRLAAASDALYVQELEAGLGRLRRVPFGGKGSQRLALPGDGAIAALAVDRRRPGVAFPIESWTRSRLWYRYDPSDGRVRDTRLLTPAAVDVSGYESTEVEVPSHDGTLVPLSIVHRKGVALDGSHPALLIGYGAYGVTLDPFFSPLLTLGWLEQGGVMAVAHVRGGGEYGEEWHLAGKEATKPNTWKDFIVCAEYLSKQGYTSADHLAGSGTSAGGILIGRAMTERPDLFRAAVPRVGVMNALRVEHEPGGPANIPEFGTTRTEAGFRALQEMDAVEHVRPGVRYPATLLTAGVHDSRVEAWQPAKMTAALQERSASGYPVLLRVGFDAGHGMGLTKQQRVEEVADTYAFLLWQLQGAGGAAVP
jgi:prolyl oligopeptidase